MKSAIFYKFIAGVLLVLLVLGAVFAADMIHKTELEVNHVRQVNEELNSRLVDVQLQLKKNEEFFQRLQNDDEFLLRIARERLHYAQPNEYIFRLDVDQLTGTPGPTNVDTDRAPLKALTSNMTKPPATTTPGATRHN